MLSIRCVARHISRYLATEPSPHVPPSESSSPVQSNVIKSIPDPSKQKQDENSRREPEGDEPGNGSAYLRYIYPIFAIGVIGYAAVWANWAISQKSQRDAERKRKQRGVGEADVGGAFELIDQNGAVVTQETYRGKWLLLYFGYTACPDVCPRELQRMATLVTEFEHTSGYQDTIIPIMITVDPQRDTVQQMREYLKQFHPRMVGLTGTPEQLQAMARAYRMYSFRSGDAKDVTRDDYLIDHSIFFLLINPDLKFINFFEPKMSLDDIKAQIYAAIDEYKRKTAGTIAIK